MKVIGIIAEYNPFHNGHLYQIHRIKESFGADFVVIAMSGNFVQRGAPALVDKYARTKMALSCGADLVIELPVLWATSSAEEFAMAGISLFEKMGCVDGICFGAETDHLPLLSSLAKILAREPNAFRILLSSYLKEGLSFPAARANALHRYVIESCTEIASAFASVEELSSVLTMPNNILALEYLKALHRRHSPLTPILIKREGAAYHDTKLLFSSQSECKTPASCIASASGIRHALLHEHTLSATPLPALEKMRAAIPEAAFVLFSEYLTKYPPLTADDFSQILGYCLLHTDKGALSGILDANEELANRIFKSSAYFLSFSQFCERNKSRNITYTRISRLLLHLILDITQELSAAGKELDYIPYLRLLGFRKTSKPLLYALGKQATVPIVSKLSHAKNLLSGDALSLLNKDLFSADLYEQIKRQKGTSAKKSVEIPFCHEYMREIIRL
ncbi:MAG: nucleotidyltransferase family protein [Roseburia sp.]